MFFVISFTNKNTNCCYSTVPTHVDVFPPESLLKKAKATQAQSEKAAADKAASKKVCFHLPSSSV